MGEAGDLLPLPCPHLALISGILFNARPKSLVYHHRIPALALILSRYTPATMDKHDFDELVFITLKSIHYFDALAMVVLGA